MIIKELVLSSFGKFSNKSIQLEEGINIIYGKNEAGKTTVHKFIEGMFFGFFKQYSKRKIYSDDYEKYNPWNQNEYKGILKYIHNNSVYRIERNFIKGNDDVKIFDDETGEDISYLFEYDKTTRLYQPSSIHLDMNNVVFNNTISINQLGAKTEENLSKEVKDSLINLGGSLDEDISVKKVIEKLDKKISEIGTKGRIKTSPYGKLVDEIASLNVEKEKASSILSEMKNYQEKLNSLSKELQSLIKEKDNIKKKLLILEGYEAKIKYDQANRIIEEINHLDKEKNKLKGISLTEINDSLSIYEELEEEKNKLVYNNEESNLKFLKSTLKENVKKISKINIFRIISLILQLLVIICGFFISKSLFLLSVLPIFTFAYTLFSSKKIASSISELKIQISNLEKKENKRNKRIEEIEYNLKTILAEFNCNSKQDIRKLASNYSNNLFLLESKKNLLSQITSDNSLDQLMTKAKEYSNVEYKDIVGFNKDKLENKLKELNDTVIMKQEELTRLEERVNNLYPDSNRLVLLEEDIMRKTKLKEEYESKLASLELAKNTIERISKNIQRDFAPRLNQEVGEIFSRVTNNKYSEVKINEALDIKIVDPTNNMLIDIEKLSGGTIDQVYFATRLGVVDIIKGKDKLPLILDDCFIQYDKDRLSNAIEFLKNESVDRQIILFTCHTIEKELLDNDKFQYNYIQI